MKRREAIKLLGAAAASLVFSPSVVRAQARPVLGFLGSVSFKTFTAHADGFLQGFKDSGFVDGRNATIEYRWAEGHFDRLPALAAELVGRPVDLLITVGGNVAALAAKRATSKIPTVFLTGDDPVASGLVTSLSRPGGHMTGVTWLGGELGAKNLEQMRELLPDVTVIGILLNPTRPTADAQLKNAQEAARAVGKTLRVFPVKAAIEVATAFELARAEKIGALLVASDPLFLVDVKGVADLAKQHAIPTVYFLREFVVAGGLMSYGADIASAAKLCGDYAGRILKGANPADLPIQQSTKIELVLNLKTAKALGLTIPITLLGRADEVIE
ncbi:MAG: ABC transporter substrate-binding protein [Alphaproteobacteria bacterium]|nr:ABC transporter substrate-binding protein [Alphaproteobacteria bacterium]